MPSVIVKEPARVAFAKKELDTPKVEKADSVKDTPKVEKTNVKDTPKVEKANVKDTQKVEKTDSVEDNEVAVNTGDATGGVSGWSIGLGALVLGGLAAAAGGGGGGGSSSGDGGVTTSWSSVSGWGEIDVLAALSSLTGEEYVDTADADDVSWGINRSDANDVNALGYTGNGVVIAIIDSGIDTENSDIMGNVIYQYDYVNDDTDATDDNGHGTAVASIIAAANNGEGLTGAAYDAELMILKVLNADGAGYASDISEAIRYAVDHGADIISMSLGGEVGTSVDCLEALQYADDHGVLVVIASGNEYASEPAPPAIAAQEIDGILAVGAIDIDGLIADFSNDAGSSTPYGYVVAAGVDVEVYDLGGGTVLYDGTSFSAPLVAAEAAILLSTGLIADNTSTDEALVNLITSSANPVV
ncbi:MAG: S8 family serine peptidase [Campylobacterales bacterium]|nr:S8 family serine peptidase [Campylobacterales bacterium]